MNLNTFKINVEDLSIFYFMCENFQFQSSKKDFFLLLCTLKKEEELKILKVGLANHKIDSVIGKKKVELFQNRIGFIVYPFFFF